MKKPFLIILSSVLCIVLAVVAYFWVSAMISSNYAFRSPIKDTPPAPGAALGDASTRRVVIVLIDALRYDTSMNESIMPTLAKLRSEGAQAMMHSQAPSFSEPGYTTILTGAWPWLNDGPAFNLDYNEIPTFTQDNLFSAAHRDGLTTAISGFNWFEKLVPQSAVDLSFYTAGEDNQADEDVVAAALPWLKEDKAQLTLIHIDQVDYAGHHEGGPRSINWAKASTRADSLLAQIVSTLDLQKDTILVISDHGQIDAGGHGGQDPIVLKEPFVLVGAGVKPGNYGDVNMVDVAPTLAALLGVNIPASAMGEVRTPMLNLNESVTAALPAAVEKQQTTLLNTFASAIGAKLDPGKIPSGANVSQYETVINELRVNREVKERIPRAILAGILLALVVFWLIRQFKKGSMAWIIGGLTFIILFNFRYAIWDQKTYSVSSITSESALISYVAITAALALLIAWLAIMLDQSYFKLSPLAAAERTFGLIFTILFIAGLPAIFNFVINGPLVTWTLPNYLFSFLFILSGIQVLVIALLGLVLVGLTAFIAYLVAKRSVKKAVKRVKK